MSNERIKRDENKYIIASHHAFNKTFECIEYFDLSVYGIVYNRTLFYEEILRKYEIAYKLFKENHPNKTVTIFDKALCFAMVLKKFDNFSCTRAFSAPRRIALLNERYIVEFMLSILHYSEYSVRNPGKGNGVMIDFTPFDISTLFAEHKDVLEANIRKMMLLLAEEEFKANEISDVLRETYDLAILYGNCFDEKDFTRARKRIRVKEAFKAPKLTSEECDTLKWHREDMNLSYSNKGKLY